MARRARCPVCGLVLEPGAPSCPACSPSGDAGPDPGDRVRIGREMDHLLSVLASLRLIYFMFAVLLGGLFFTFILFAGHAIRGSTLAAAVTVLLGVAAASNAVAAWDVYAHPRFWSLLLAVVATPLLLLSGLSFLAGPGVFAGLRLLLVALGTSGLWYGAFQTLRLGGLLRTHPDLAAARKQRAKAGALPEGKASRRLREKGRIADAAGHRHALVYGGGAVGAALLVAAGVYAWLHPPVETAADGFRSSWNSADWAGIEARFEPAQRDRMGKGLRILLRRRGWLESPPSLGEPTIEEKRSGRSAAVFGIGAAGESVETEWTLADGTWTLASVRLPER